MQLMQTTLLMLASAMQAVSAAGNATNSSLLVSTNVGTYQGFYSSETVRSWLGIRFGQPTNGTRRFRPPQRSGVLPAGSVFNATSFSPSCPNAGQVAGTGTNFSDDCLSLNIWSPSTDRLNSSSEGAAVMIWIYGGGYTSGSTSLALYNGNNFVRDQQNLIVVTINYRISIYGFPAGSGANPYELNAGLQDQRLAIEWVYNNIRNFGGDPSKITLFGESAGASSIGSYVYTYAQDPIARAIILESGTEFLNGAITVPENNNASIVAWNTVAQTVGCNSTDSLQQLTCMQRANLSQLSSAVASNSRSRAVFLPTQDGIRMLNSSEYDTMSSLGQFAKLPVLIGTNNNEGTTLTSAYGGGVATLSNGITTFSFTCPAAKFAAARTNASVPVWQYRYFGTWPNITPPNSSLGAFHGSEIALVFGNYNQSMTYNVSQAQIETSKVMQAAWTAFAQDPVNGLNTFGWPQYQSNGTSLIELAREYYNASTSVLTASTLPVVTFNNSQAYNADCSA